jgi:primosomal protein N' (replication factor Y)
MSDLVDVAIFPLRASLTYRLPKDLGELTIGQRVKVPLGKRWTTGFIVGRRVEAEILPFQKQITTVAPLATQSALAFFKEDPQPEPVSNEEQGIRRIAAACEPFPCFHAEEISFYEKVAHYYGAPLSHVLDCAVPPIVAARFNRYVQWIGGNEPSLPTAKARKRTAIIEYLQRHPVPHPYSEILRLFRGAQPILKKLLTENLIVISAHEELSDVHGNEKADWAQGSVTLAPEQAHACTAITESLLAKRFDPYLLHGATGSGKTEVYIEAIQTALKNGLGSLVIVPEIALTPQLIDRFRARLDEPIAVLHSALHKRVRWDAWRALIEKRCRVAIGVRSGVFAPVANLGLIIVDEEHDGSYKQAEGLRYNARDLALLRGKISSCPVVLGSATPSLESYYHARTKKFHLLNLPKKFGQAAERAIEIVDLSSVKPWEMKSKNVSPRLFQALEETISSRDQAFILYNRRGFSSYLQCEKCSKVIECPNCSVTLTFHQRKNAMLCHYCGASTVPPVWCPTCALDPDIKEQQPLIHRGSGTERIFDELRDLFPDVRIERLDRDSVSDLESYQAILNRMRSGETRILVGTQMIAKGHDMPNVTLVGVADSDVGLHIPDFRANERVFQLLTQAAGRAGRHEKRGRVILQTRVPQHICLQSTLSQNYGRFAIWDLKNRQGLNYPPYVRLLRVVASGESQQLPYGLLNEYVKKLKTLVQAGTLPLAIMGPAPAPLTRIKRQWRWQLLLKAQKSSVINAALKQLQALKIPKEVRVTFDVDPQEML